MKWGLSLKDFFIISGKNSSLKSHRTHLKKNSFQQLSSGSNREERRAMARWKEERKQACHKYLCSSRLARSRTPAPRHRYNSLLSIVSGGNAFSSPQSAYRRDTRDRKARDVDVVVGRLGPIRSTCCKAINIDPTCPPSIHPACTGCGGRPQETGKRESDRGRTKSGSPGIGTRRSSKRASVIDSDSIRNDGKRETPFEISFIFLGCLWISRKLKYWKMI